MATRTGLESALDRPVFSTTDKSYTKERLASPGQSRRAYGLACKYRERLGRRGMSRRPGFPCRDGSTDCRQRGAIFEVDTGSIRSDPKLHPQAVQVHPHRLVFHFCVQRLENTYADRAVSGSQGILKIPFLPDVAAGVENATKGIFQTLRIVCLAANLNVS
jgi:hypothetical protein